MATVFMWLLIGILGVILLGAAVFILGSIISILVGAIYQSVIGVEHAVERGHQREHGFRTHGAAFHH